VVEFASSEPLLSADALRIDVDGMPVCEGLSFVATGERALLLGAGRGLFDALVGLRPVTSGSLLLRGEVVSRAAQEGCVAGALPDAALPPAWTPREYVTWSARLAGCEARVARASADDALRAMGLTALRDIPSPKLPPLARRATLVAAALATGAETLALFDPLAELNNQDAAFYSAQLATALDGGAWIVVAPRMPLGSPLALGADVAVIVSDTGVLAQGKPVELAAAERCFELCIDGAFGAIAPALAERSVHAEERGGKIVLDLGQAMTTRELVTLCAEAGVAVVELVPLHRALS
jgi:iron complex transport system ATP-binding protein